MSNILSHIFKLTVCNTKQSVHTAYISSANAFPESNNPYDLIICITYLFCCCCVTNGILFVLNGVNKY